MSKYLCLVSLLLAVAMVNSKFEQLSSKTRYKDVFTKNIVLPPGYKPSKALLLIRHATCTPDESVYNNMMVLLRELQEKIRTTGKKPVGKDVQIFLDWTATPYQFVEGAYLLPEGIMEITQFATRLKDTLPKFFDGLYDAAKYPIKAIPSGRAIETSRVFLKTLFNESSLPEEIPTCSETDLLLMFEYGRTVDPGRKQYRKLVKRQRKDFIKSRAFTNVRQKFANKFGLHVEEVDYGYIKSLWDICRWNRLIYSEDQCPCHFFEEEDIGVMLKLDEDCWWSFSSTSVSLFNAKLSCGIFDHLLRFLKSKKKRPLFPMYFGHRTNVLLAHTALGLDPVKENFSTSHVIPFMANLMVIVFQKKGTESLVGFYFNETLTAIPLVDNSTYCDYCRLSDVIIKLDAYLVLNECEKFFSEAEDKSVGVPYDFSRPSY